MIWIKYAAWDGRASATKVIANDGLFAISCKDENRVLAIVDLKYQGICVEQFYITSMERKN
jgi:hypothetical protein